MTENFRNLCDSWYELLDILHLEVMYLLFRYWVKSKLNSDGPHEIVWCFFGFRFFLQCPSE